VIVDVQRDLTSVELWAESLARSRERRGVGRGWAMDLLMRGHRDLTELEMWRDSHERSLVRRHAARTSFDVPLPSARGLSVAALLAITAVPATSLVGGLRSADAVAAQVSGPLLERGDEGPSVAKLQRALGRPADGVFGPRTAHAVRALQKKRGLAVDGAVGARTWAALRGGGSGDAGGGGGGGGDGAATRGPSVSKLQRALGVPEDGVYGPQTKRAVLRYQRSHDLAVDGVVGEQTWSELGIESGRVLKRAKLRGEGGSGGGSSASRPGKVSQIVSAANRIAKKPYRYGGGHGSFEDSGYDCSGAVSYALRGAGLIDAPRSSGGFVNYGKPGKGEHVTIYAKGSHMFMVVDGRRFDTTGRESSGSFWQSDMRDVSGYSVRHPPGL